MTGQSHMVRRAGQFGGGVGVKERVIWEQGRVSLLLTAASGCVLALFVFKGTMSIDCCWWPSGLI